MEEYLDFKNDFLSSKQKAVISGQAIKFLLNRSITNGS